MTFFVDLRQASVGGSLAASPQVYDDKLALGLADLISACSAREVLFVAHGFNVDRAGGIDHLGALEEALDLLAPNGLPFVFVGVLWPGDSKWTPVIDYPVEGDEAISSGKMLATFITNQFPSAATISFASHSLGARVVLEAVRGLPINSSRLYVLAGAIEDDCFVAEYQDSAKKVGKISVLASLDDDVLEWAFPAGNLLGTILMRGEPYARVALGRHGPAPPSTMVTPGWQLPDGWGYGHGNYLPSGSVAPPSLFETPVPFPGPSAGIPEGYSDTTIPAWRPMWVAALILSRW